MSEIEVTIVLPNGGARKAEVPNDVIVRDLLAEMTSLLGLPTVGPDGRPMGYRLDSKALGRELQESETLADAGVPEDDRLVLTADIVRVFSPEKVLKRVIAEGELAKFRQLTDDGKEVHAEAKKMEYLSKTSIVILTGNAKLWEGGNEFVSERIEYHLLKEQVHGGTGEKGGRVEAIIMPETIEEQKNDQ